MPSHHRVKLSDEIRRTYWHSIPWSVKVYTRRVTAHPRSKLRIRIIIKGVRRTKLYSASPRFRRNCQIRRYRLTSTTHYVNNYYHIIVFSSFLYSEEEREKIYNKGARQQLMEIFYSFVRRHSVFVFVYNACILSKVIKIYARLIEVYPYPSVNH